MTSSARSYRRPISMEVLLERQPDGPRDRHGARGRPGRGRFRADGCALAGDDGVVRVVIIEVGVEFAHERDTATLVHGFLDRISHSQERYPEDLRRVADRVRRVLAP